MHALNSDKKKIYLQIEHQERELDAKVLFSLFAAEYGYETVLGYKGALREVHVDFPQGAWIHHNARGRGKPLEYFWYKRLGFAVIVLDEEGLVRQTDNLFLRKHMPGVFKNVDRVFAWGESDRDFWLRSNMISPKKLAITGNPRADLLRPELSKYYEKKVSEIKARVGKYVLVNTNFPTVNNAMGVFHKFNISDKTNYAMTEKEMKGFLSHKKDIFHHFVSLIPELAAAVHPHKLIVRPHPSEDRTIWDRQAKELPSVQVILDGGVAPWIMGSELLIHNNCTTAVEAALLRKSVATFVPVQSDRFDNQFCNAMGTRCVNGEQLVSCVTRALSGEYVGDGTREKLLSHHVNTDAEKFACEFMLEEIDQLLRNGLASKRAGKLEIGLRNIIAGTVRFLRRDGRKSRIRSEYLRRKTSDIDTAEIISRLESFKSCLGRFHGVECINIGRDLHVISRHDCSR